MVKDELQEDAVDVPSCYTRRSPRTCVRRLNPVASQDTCKNHSEPKKYLKRKNTSFEDDPSYSEVEDEDEILEHQKKVPGYRCSPHLIPDLMGKLSEKQKGWVRNINLHSLQDMIVSSMPKSLTMWLVDRVDTSNDTLDVCGTPVDIKDTVVRILKLPCGDIKVPPPLNGRSKAKRPRGDSSHPDQKHSDNGRGQTAKDATKVLLAENEDEVEFCQSFVMLVLCIYLAPTTSLNINRNYYAALMDVSKIGLMDWCGFIADYLIQGIGEFRKSKASHVQVPGCVHILPLIYIDALIKYKALILPEALKIPEGEPRIHFIRTEHLAFLASSDVKSRSKDHIEYGLLQESCSSFSVVPHNSTTLVSSKQSQKIDYPSVPCASLNGKAEENFAADIFGSLFKEIKESREQLIQDFQQKMESSELKILSRFQRKFLRHFAIIPTTSPIEDNLLTTAAPSPVHAGKTSSSNVTQDPKNNCSLENPSSEISCRQSPLMPTDTNTIEDPSNQVIVDQTSSPESNIQPSVGPSPSNMRDTSNETRTTTQEVAQSCIAPTRNLCQDNSESILALEDQNSQCLIDVIIHLLAAPAGEVFVKISF